MFLRLIPVSVLCALAGLTILATPALSGTAPLENTPEQAVLTLEAALARTLASNPDLTVASEQFLADAAEALAANRLPNPELTVSLENVAGTGAYREMDAAELTVEVSQPLELGGKRRLRREAAELGRELAALGQVLARADVLAATRHRFITVLAAQEELTLAREQAELAAQSLGAAEERISAGKAPMIDRLRLQGEAGLARLAVARAERSLATARRSLAAGWGDSPPGFAEIAGDLATLPATPEWSAVEATLEQSPEQIGRRIATQLQRIELEQIKASRIPDPRLTVGWRQFEESGDDALLFGISFPLPLFNQSQHDVAAASSRFNAAKARELSTRNQLRATLRATWQALADASAEAEVFANQIVPAAAEGFAAAEFGYRAGKFGLLELLDAQRALPPGRDRAATPPGVDPHPCLPLTASFLKGLTHVDTTQSRHADIHYRGRRPRLAGRFPLCPAAGRRRGPRPRTTVRANHRRFCRQATVPGRSRRSRR
jgi:cobalt-zinc-cadmium efflux system outer membrane protein